MFFNRKKKVDIEKMSLLLVEKSMSYTFSCRSQLNSIQRSHGCKEIGDDFHSLFSIAVILLTYSRSQVRKHFTEPIAEKLNNSIDTYIILEIASDYGELSLTNWFRWQDYKMSSENPIYDIAMDSYERADMFCSSMSDESKAAIINEVVKILKYDIWPLITDKYKIQ